MLEHTQQTVEQVVDVPVTTDAGTSGQRTVEQVDDVSFETEAGAGVPRTVEQMIDVPDHVEELVRQRPVEQIISVAETTIDEATPTLDGAELDVTQRVKAKAAPRNIPQLERSIRVECERVRFMEHERRFKRARERSAERQKQALADGLPLELAASAGRGLHNPDFPSDGSSDWIHCSCQRRIRSSSTNERACARDGVQLKHDAFFFWCLSKLEKQCIATPETHAGLKVRRRNCWVDKRCSFSVKVTFSCDGLPSYPSVDGSEASPEVCRVTSDSRNKCTL